MFNFDKKCNKIIIMKTNRSNCPLVSALDILGDKWTLVVVRDIFNGKKTFGEFLESPEKISTSVLTDRLQLLEGAGIAKHILSIIDKKVKLYYLTDRGIDLFPMLFEMVMWSKRILDKKFHPHAMDWFERNKSLSPEQAIFENKKNYKQKREEILELQ